MTELYDRLQVEPRRLLGVIHLEQITQLDRPVTLEELRANDIPFARNIVSGRGLSLEEVATILQLGSSTAAGCRAECYDVCFGSALTSVFRCDMLPST